MKISWLKCSMGNLKHPECFQPGNYECPISRYPFLQKIIWYEDENVGNIEED